jgi:hypothetical protein
MSGHWVDAYDQYIVKGEIVDNGNNDENYHRVVALMQSVKVEEISRFNSKYKIKGYLINEWKLAVNIEVKDITSDIGYDDYDKLEKGMEHIFGIITDWIFDDKVRQMDGLQYAFAFCGSKEEDIARIENMSKEELNEFQKKHMEERGCIVLDPEEMEDPNIDDVKAESKDIKDTPKHEGVAE